MYECNTPVALWDVQSNFGTRLFFTAAYTESDNYSTHQRPVWWTIVYDCSIRVI